MVSLYPQPIMVTGDMPTTGTSTHEGSEDQSLTNISHRHGPPELLVSWRTATKRVAESSIVEKNKVSREKEDCLRLTLAFQTKLHSLLSGKRASKHEEAVRGIIRQPSPSADDYNGIELLS